MYNKLTLTTYIYSLNVKPINSSLTGMNVLRNPVLLR